MKRIALCLPFLAALPTQAQEAPRVVSTTPAEGASLAPGVHQLKVVFDRDMRTDGYGFMKAADGTPFPPLAGQVRWLDTRTCAFPARLSAGATYAVGINTRGSTRFQAADGTPAASHTWRFRAEAPGPDAHRAAAKRLREAIEQRYSYRDRLNLDWDALFAEHGPAMEGATDATAFAAAAAKLLAAAKDPHVHLRAGGTPVYPNARRVQPNVTLARVRAAVPNLRQRSRCVFSGTLDARTGYLLIGSWAREREADLRVLGAVLGDLGKLPRLIVDLRGNGGGDERLARRFAGHFVKERVVYARHELRDPGSKTGFGPPQDRVLEPRTPCYGGRLLVLIGPHVMSSAEASVLMLKQVPGVKLVGAPTAGSSGNPQPHDLGNGVTAWLPSWRAFAPDGALIEGAGIAPDVEAAWDAAGSDDPVIAAALRVLEDGE